MVRVLVDIHPEVRILSPATHATTSPVLPVPVPSARSRSPRKALEMATLVGKKCLGRWFHGWNRWNRGMELGDSMVDVWLMVRFPIWRNLRVIQRENHLFYPILEYPSDFPIRSLFQQARLRWDNIFFSDIRVVVDCTWESFLDVATMQHHNFAKMAVQLLAHPENTVLSANIVDDPARVLFFIFFDGAVRPARVKHAFFLLEVFLFEFWGNGWWDRSLTVKKFGLGEPFEGTVEGGQGKNGKRSSKKQFADMYVSRAWYGQQRSMSTHLNLSFRCLTLKSSRINYSKNIPRSQGWLAPSGQMRTSWEDLRAWWFMLT